MARAAISLFRFSDTFHDVGHVLVFAVGHCPDHLQNLILRAVLLGLLDQILLLSREIDAAQVVRDVRWLVSA